MDGRHVEPRDRLHQDQRRLRPLLRRTILGEVSGNTRPPIRFRFRPDASARAARTAASLANVTHDLRELDERSLPQGNSKRVHRPCLRYDGSRAVAYVSGADEAVFPDARLLTQTLRSAARAFSYVVRCIY